MDKEEPFTSKSFHDYLKEGRLMGTRCKECGLLMAPPRPLCSGCGSREIEWFEFKGEGSLEAYTVIHVAPASLLEKAPYIVGVVKTVEGPMITGRIVGVDPKEGQNLKIGMKVSLTPLFENDLPIIAFKPT